MSLNHQSQNNSTAMEKSLPLILALLLMSGVPGAAETIDVDLPYQEFISAVSGDDSATVNRMLGQGYDYRTAIPNNNNVSPLMIAAGTGRMQMLRAFLGRGDDVNARSSCDETAFTRAVWEEHFPEAETLLAHGADPTLGVVGNGHPALDDCYNRAFAEPGRRPFLNLMVASTPASRAKPGLSPALPTVLDHEDADFVRRLIEAGADVDYRMTGTQPFEGFTPLIFASAKGLPDMVGLLLAHGANINAADTNGVTALMHAIANLRWNSAEDIERRYQSVIVQLLAAKPDLARKATLVLLHPPTGTGTALDMARLYLNNERGAAGSKVKKKILCSIEDAYRAAGLLKPSKNTAKATAVKKKTVSRKTATQKRN
jgi:ankyrin repeat protein